jgi:hypothetical protein
VTPGNDLSFGAGYSGHWVGWHPDRDLNPQYDGIPDLERAALVLLCPHGQGVVPVHPPEYQAVFGQPSWTVESWEPLTLSPSILRTECGCHGYIRSGVWVAA